MGLERELHSIKKPQIKIGDKLEDVLEEIRQKYSRIIFQSCRSKKDLSMMLGSFFKEYMLYRRRNSGSELDVEEKEEIQNLNIKSLSPEEQKKLLLVAFKQNAWVQKRTADDLGVTISWLRKKIREFEIWKLAPKDIWYSFD